MAEPLETINESIIQCRKCPRLIEHIERVATQKVKRFSDHDYWGKPVPGFGDPNARLLIIGLAPAAHGATRTGRMFTGDKSGDWLYQVLYETGFSNQQESYARDDGLQLNDVYITALTRCAPPRNKPAKEEINTCTELYLSQELNHFNQVPFILCLGRLAFDTYRKMHGLKKLEFGHHKIHQLDHGSTLISSYHPSRQNTQTGKLKWEDWLQVFQHIRSAI